ncbi:MAG: phosphoglucosamine mutase [Thermoplasmata archaeon]
MSGAQINLDSPERKAKISQIRKDIENIFRAYDIRGVFNQDFNAEIATEVGVAFGTFLGGKGRVCIGRDVRKSSEIIEMAFSAGLASTGVALESVGMVPIPVANFWTWQGKYDAGVYITASHNPPEYNGIRFRHPDGSGYTSGNQKIKEIYLNGEVKKAKWDSLGKISSVSTDEVLKSYMDYIASRIQTKRNMTVVVDPGNGAACVVAPQLMKKIGCTVSSINDNIDGAFPARGPNPTLKTLGACAQKVLEKKADFGVGYDGDSDRAIFVDDKGRTCTTEQIGVILARKILSQTGGGKVIANVPCSMMLEEEIQKAGGELVRTRVGDVFVCEAIKELKAVFALEISAHLFLPTFYIFDDAILASMLLAQILSETDTKLSEMVDRIPKYPAIEKAIHVPDRIKFEILERMKKDYVQKGWKVDLTDGVKVFFDESWALLRPSNTEPVIRLFTEAKTEHRAKELEEQFEKELEKYVAEFRLT